MVPVKDADPKELRICVQRASIQDMAVTKDYAPLGSVVKCYETYDESVVAESVRNFVSMG